MVPQDADDGAGAHYDECAHSPEIPLPDMSHAGLAVAVVVDPADDSCYCLCHLDSAFVACVLVDVIVAFAVHVCLGLVGVAFVSVFVETRFGCDVKFVHDHHLTDVYSDS